MNNSPNKLKAVFISALVMTLLSITPILSLINLFCCAGVIIGGFAGAYFYNNDLKKVNGFIEYKDGVMIGILSGIVTAVIYTGVLLLYQLYSETNLFIEMTTELEKLGVQLSPEFYKGMDYFNDEINQYGFSPTLTIVSLFIYMIIYPLFGAIGGLLAVSLFKRIQPTQTL